MANFFLAKYGQAIGENEYCYDEAANQILIYTSHLKDTETGLLYYAYDEDGSEDWADPVTHHSPEFWGRSIGWTSMALVEILDVLPRDHPKRSAILKLLQDLVAGLAKYQDQETGLWWQVVNKGGMSGNWLETSSSCMYTYIIAHAVEKGYFDAKYINLALKGYKGALTKISIGDDGLTNVVDICEGTGVAKNYDYYIDRDRKINDLRSIPAFILMCEEMGKRISK